MWTRITPKNSLKIINYYWSKNISEELRTNNEFVLLIYLENCKNWKFV